MQAANSILVRSTITNWIYDMFEHFKPDIIAKVAIARLAIFISFDG